MTIPTFVRAALIGASCLVSACGNGGGENGNSGGTSGGCSGQSCPFNYASFNGSSPTVSFRTDLMGDQGTGPNGAGGILRRSCAFGTTCHGAEVGSKGGLFIAPPLLDGTNPYAITDADIDTVLHNITTGIINVPSKTLPSMMRVKPGDPENSFLMRKVDGCFEGLTGCTVQSGAVSNNECGDRMPRSSQTLCADERDTIRRWIAQGANP